MMYRVKLITLSLLLPRIFKWFSILGTVWSRNELFVVIMESLNLQIVKTHKLIPNIIILQIRNLYVKYCPCFGKEDSSSF